MLFLDSFFILSLTFVNAIFNAFSIVYAFVAFLTLTMFFSVFPTLPAVFRCSTVLENLIGPLIL